MESLLHQLESNINMLHTDIGLARKLEIVKTSKQKHKEITKLVGQAQTDIKDYAPQKKPVDNVAETISGIENGIDSLKNLSIDDCLNEFRDLMDDITSLENFIQNHQGLNETLEKEDN